jgi:monoamine oxidase
MKALSVKDGFVLVSYSVVMKRRQILKLLALGSAWGFLPSSLSQDAKKVLVIGAGIAGISAARKLQAEGVEVVALEARNRVGGRIWTDHSLGVPLDLGAAWIHGNSLDNPVAKIVEDNDIKTLVTDYDKAITYDTDGTLLEDGVVTEADEFFFDVLQEAEAYGETLKQDISLQEGLEQALSNKRLSAQGHRLFDHMTSVWIEHEYGADVSELSLWNAQQGEAFDGDDVLFPGGYQQLIDVLALGLDIRVNHVVSKVSYSANGVSVTTNQGVFQADYAIITLPLGVLQSNAVTFSPALPQEKIEAIQSLGMGSYNKTCLRFPKVFWPKEPDWLDYVNNPKGLWSEFLNICHYGDAPILIGINPGTVGRELEILSDKETVESAMNVLKTMFGKAIPEPSAFKIARWHGDPFAKGAYSFIPVGSSGDTLDALAANVNDKLFFAGEATSRDYQSTVHGGYLSGLRAADEILEL